MDHIMDTQLLGFINDTDFKYELETIMDGISELTVIQILP